MLPESSQLITVEPGVCFNGYGIQDSVDITQFKGQYMATLHTTCYLCHEPISVCFGLGSHVSTTPTWRAESVWCGKCRVWQKKKIKFYANREEQVNR